MSGPRMLVAPFTCPHCGRDLLPCDFCSELATVEGWHRSGDMIRRRIACDEHAKLLIGHDKFQQEEEE